MMAKEARNIIAVEEGVVVLLVAAEVVDSAVEWAA